MDKKEIQDVIKYWITVARRDYDTMLGLFKMKRYPESLFFGHIVLEKILKALCVQTLGEHPPFTHDLVRLQKMVRVAMSKKDIDFLDTMNDFNIRARYPEYKLMIYKTCTKTFTQKHLNSIKIIYTKLCRQLL